jgi:hypothetical protein
MADAPPLIPLILDEPRVAARSRTQVFYRRAQLVRKILARLASLPLGVRDERIGGSYRPRLAALAHRAEPFDRLAAC